MDGSYLTPSGTCSDTGDVLPDEVGSVEPGPRGSSLFVPANLDELEAAARDCLGARFNVSSFAFRSYRNRAKLRADGTLKGTNRFRAVGRFNGRRVTLSVRSRYRGTLVESSAVGAFVESGDGSPWR